MVVKEAGEKIVSNDRAACVSFTAKRICDEVEIFFQRRFSVGSFEPLAQAEDDIVRQVFLVCKRDDVVSVRLKRDVFACVPISARIGKAVHIE